MTTNGLTLKGLEVFEAIAKTGSVQAVAAETGLSISTVSHHLRSLEQGLGVDLLDHSRRPMVLTPAGSVFVRHVEEGLRAIRRGEIELTSGNIIEARVLRLGLVDDFDGEIGSELAELLAHFMPKCIFRHRTRPSHEILNLLTANDLDIAVATRPQNDIPGLIEYPLLKDPFVVASPAAHAATAEDHIAGKGKLPFLRYPQSQMIGQQIETQLRRNRLDFEKRYELESNQMLLSMVAGGSGWAITTAASYMRTNRLHGQIRISPLPIRRFSRSISLFTTEIYTQTVAELIHAAIRRLIRQRFIDPAVADMPWLANAFALMGDDQISRTDANLSK